MLANNEEQITGLWVGFWEGHHKALQLNGIADSKLVVLEKTIGRDQCWVTYPFTNDTNINNQNIDGRSRSWIDTYDYLCGLIFSRENARTNSSDFNSPEGFILGIRTLCNQLTDKRVYIIEINPSHSYAIIILSTYLNLPKINNIINSDTFDNWQVDSLVNSLLLISMLEITDNWQEFLNSSSHSAFRYLSEKELLRRAASLFLDRISRSLNNLCENDLLKLNHFYTNIDQVCSMGYEKRPTKGFILVGNIEKYRPLLVAKFIKPILLSNHKAARKVIEMTGDSRFVLSDGVNLYGVGIEKEKDSNYEASTIRINFQNYNEWSVNYDTKNEKSFLVKNGTPVLPRVAITQAEFSRRMSSRFENCEVDCDRIYKIVELSLKASHGALIVVCNEAQAEATRLENQATLIEPTVLEGEMLKGVFSIDGAIMLDLQGVCYAVGVILDGIADHRGDSARGSRYNSSLRYIYSFDQKPNATIRAMAIVVSEDGQFDTIPWLYG